MKKLAARLFSVLAGKTALLVSRHQQVWARVTSDLWMEKPNVCIDLIQSFLQSVLPDRPFKAAFLNYYFNKEWSREAEWMLTGNAESDPGKVLYEIPSETSVRERNFLYNFFRSAWSGRDDVLEVGPFLGGTTRAIALGMQNNPRKSPESRLLTFDRFSDYYSSDALLEYIQPLFDKDLLSDEDRAQITEHGEFLPVFHKLHDKQPYSKFLDVTDHVLPDTKEKEAECPNLFRLPDGMKLEAVFIDGCKGWYPTKYFMREVVPATSVGAYYIFQDYGWYTCFWIPAFMQVFKSCFQFVTRVDSTYCFQQTQPLLADEVEQEFPDTAEAMGVDALDKHLSRAAREARNRGDVRGWVIASIQTAGAHAYCGDSDRARVLLNELKENPEAYLYADLIEAALHSPTYRPEGPVLLDD